MRMRSQVVRMRSSSNKVMPCILRMCIALFLELRMRTTLLRMRNFNLEKLLWKFGAKLDKKTGFIPLVPITKT